MNVNKIVKFIVCVFGPLCGGILVSLVTNSNSYTVINKPFLSPPGVIFPIAWSILYILMGISVYMLLKKDYDKNVVRVFLIQLAFNYLWPFLFFNLKIYFISTLCIISLLLCVGSMISLFYKNKKIAGILQFPYFFWLLFALYLNIGVLILN